MIDRQPKHTRVRPAAKAVSAQLAGALFAVALVWTAPLIGVSATAAPFSTITAPADQLIDVAFTFDVAFSYTYEGETDTGFGPFLDILLPTALSDAVGPAAVRYQYASAAHALLPTSVTRQIFPNCTAVGGASLTACNSTCVDHPSATASATIKLAVCAPPGYTLVTVELPFAAGATALPPQTVTVLFLSPVL
jgi:hypothetical protein